MAKQQTQRGQRVKREGCGCLVLRFSTEDRLEMLRMLSRRFALFLVLQKKVHRGGSDAKIEGTRPSVVERDKAEKKTNGRKRTRVASCRSFYQAECSFRRSRNGERGGRESTDKEPGGQVKPCDIEGGKEIEVGNSLGYLAALPSSVTSAKPS